MIENVVIIGSGAAGLTAALYGARALLKPVVITGQSVYGQLALTSDIENFPGFRTGSGSDLMDILYNQAAEFGAEFVMSQVLSINYDVSPFEVNVYGMDESIKTRAIIIASGANSIWLNAENEGDVQCISTCATCDGFFYRDRDVIVIGGGDSAMEEAIFLTRFAASVTIIHRRDTFRASNIMLERAKSNDKIKWLLNKKVVRWIGEGVGGNKLSGAVIVDTVSGAETSISCDGAFLAIGHKPNTDFITVSNKISHNNNIELTDSGYIKLKENTMTSVEGIFACGDVVDDRYRQAVVAAGMGCSAALDMTSWLEMRT